MPIITSALLTPKPKASTLRPLDFETTIRVPQQYLHTRVYVEGVAEEAAFLLAEWLASRVVHGSIAFPEVIVPLTVVLRKTIKSARSKTHTGKAIGTVKALVDRIEESGKAMERRRADVSFAPGRYGEVEVWEATIDAEEMPLGKYVKVQRKMREKRQKLVDKVREISLSTVSPPLTSPGQARDGEGEILEEGP